MRTFLFVFEIEPIVAGEVYERLPLHATLVHWFKTDLSANEVLALTRDVFEKAAPIELVSEAPALFGHEHDIPVHTLAYNARVRALHWKLLQKLFHARVDHTEPKFIGHGYSPHVTPRPGRAFVPGSRARVTYVYLVEILDAPRPNRKIWARIALGASYTIPIG